MSRIERERIEQAIGVIESQRAALGEAVTDVALAALRERLDAVCKARVVPQRNTEQNALVVQAAYLSEFALFGQARGHTVLPALGAARAVSVQSHSNRLVGNES